MARRVILDTQYTFNPATRTIVIPRIIPRERFLLITNVTTNKVIYNFSDPALTITSFSQSQGTNTTNPTTTIVLNYNTTTMSATDQLSITIDEAAEVFIPDEALLDGSQKLRISTPQALIDTDFEYGLQPTKWETITLLNNRPSFYVNPQTPLTITNVTAVNGSATVTVFTSSPPTVGTPFSMQDSLFGGGNGNFVVETVSAGTSFTYTARYAHTGTTGSVYDSTLTQVYSGAFYSNSAFSLVSQPTYSGSTITVNTVEAHGLQLGDGVFITGSSASSNPPNGSFQVSSVLSNTVFQVISYQGTPTGSITGATVYARPDGIYIHRPFDGGVQFTCTNAAHGNQIIRQTRRYFRYQSGKALAMSTGTILKPNFNIDDISASGTTVTVTTKVAHYASPGTGIIVAGCNESAYNGTFTINQVIDAFRFTYNANTVPSASPASGNPVVVVSTWYGARSRTGLYDNQNGVFFEYDGQQLYAVRRFSTYQIAGFALVTNNSSLVTGAVGPGGVINTKFSKQLTPGDFIVIRGMSYRVLDILSDSAMTVSPPYRGPTLSGTNGVVISKTIDIKVPQSQFNLDRLDGTGPSGFVLDLSKMQMFYLDYSWYGAGTIRFGFRATDGKIVYCHRFVNNNQNFLAWMRSGNLPARYETNTLAPVTTLSSTLFFANSTMSVANTSGFPPAGTLLIANPSNYEYVNYTGLTPTTFTGLTRGQLGSQVASVGTTANNANVTTSSSVGGVQPGMFVTGTNIPNNTFVYAVYPGLTNTIQLTQAATGTGTTTLTLSQMGGAANTHTYSNTALIPVHLHLPAVAPTIDHWGTSVIMDGRFDDDKSLIYFYGEPVFTSIPSGASYALMSIRVSPSVDSGIPATLGLKELINRMQLKLQSVELLVSGSFLISLVLNGSISSVGGTVGTFQRVAVGTSSLSQIADHTGAVTISGGENIFGTYGVNTAGTGNISNIYQDLTQVRDLGNSILGGGYSNAGNSPFYPDGPDVVTVVATNLGAASANVIARLGWTEAQA